jgi:hypothetical protein
LNVYSEFARIDPDSRVTAPRNPREILSPAIVRNGFTSFQIVVEAKPDVEYTLYVGLNPADAVTVTLYRASAGGLSPVDLPFRGSGPAVFWMDVWCDRAAPVRRIKIEPELEIAGNWVRYPMEARVMEAAVPAETRPLVTDLHQFLCGRGREADAPARLRERNGQQDAALAQGMAKKDLLSRLGGCEAVIENPEAYLAVRDYLFRLR